MDQDTPLRAALKKLLAQGEMAKDNQMLKAHAAKNAPPAAELCAECKLMPEGEKCEKCAAAGGDDSELAGLLEQGAAEG